MTYHRIDLPVIRFGQHDLHRAELIRTQFYWPDYAGLVGGSEDEAPQWKVLFAYLTQIWLQTCYPTQSPTVLQYPMRGEGNVSFHTFPGGARVTRARIIIHTVPDDVDCVFGQSPLYYVGKCAFTHTESTSPFVMRAGFLQGGISNQSFSRYPLRYVNYLDNSFVPDEVQANGFWYHLKDGVEGTLVLSGLNEFPATCLDLETWANETLLGCFNPMQYLGIHHDAPDGPGG